MLSTAGRLVVKRAFQGSFQQGKSVRMLSTGLLAPRFQPLSAIAIRAAKTHGKFGSFSALNHLSTRNISTTSEDQTTATTTSSAQDVVEQALQTNALIHWFKLQLKLVNSKLLAYVILHL
ncbi:unnamed protein product [Rhizopus microsporus]